MSNDDGLNPLTLPDAVEWFSENGQSDGLLDYISSRGSLSICLAMAKLLWPNFVEVRGCIIVPWSCDEAYVEQWWNQLRGDRSAIEKVLNHIHVCDLFRSNDVCDCDRAMMLFAQTLKETWESALAKQFPSRSFIVTATNSENDYGPTVVFNEIRTS